MPYPGWANDSDPVFADPKAQKGGTLRHYELSFPLTFRTVGPDSNDSFRPYLLGNQMSLTYFHPNTRRPVPGLATHWAYGDDNKTVYFKLNPKAVWSDGVPVTAMDFAFALEMMRSKHIVAPWYNEYYTTKLDKVLVFDAHTFAIVGREKRNHHDMLYDYAISPRPRHFHKLDENWVRDYQWKPEPNTGPYQLGKVEKGKEIVFEPIPKLAPKADAIFRVTVKALAPGRVRFKTQLTSTNLPEPVIEMEATTIYDDSSTGGAANGGTERNP